MTALARTMGIAPTILPRGKLALHEELAPEVAEAILELPEKGDGP